MNTAQHTSTTVVKHTVRMTGPITRRDISDFIHQADEAFTKAKGRPVEFDDDCYVTGDEEGLIATFETTPAAKV